MKKLLLIFYFGLFIQVGYAMHDEQNEATQEFAKMKKMLQDKIDKDQQALDGFEKDPLVTTEKGKRLILLGQERISVMKLSLEAISENEERAKAGINLRKLNAGLVARYSTNKATMETFYEELTSKLSSTSDIN